MMAAAEGEQRRAIMVRRGVATVPWQDTTPLGDRSGVQQKPMFSSMVCAHSSALGQLMTIVGSSISMEASQAP